MPVWWGGRWMVEVSRCERVVETVRVSHWPFGSPPPGHRRRWPPNRLDRRHWDGCWD